MACPVEVTLQLLPAMTDEPFFPVSPAAAKLPPAKRGRVCVAADVDIAGQAGGID